MHAMRQIFKLQLVDATPVRSCKMRFYVVLSVEVLGSGIVLMPTNTTTTTTTTTSLARGDNYKDIFKHHTVRSTELEQT